MVDKPLTAREIIGKSPVPLAMLVVGKSAMGGCWFFFIIKAADADAMWFDSQITRTIGIIAEILGLIVVILSLLQLGRSAAVGLPTGETMLRTGGLYAVSRNPVYLGAFLACLGSCLYSIHPVNLLLFALTVAIHHRIVKQEEKFLEGRFGREWTAYRQRVPRYLGPLRRTNETH